MSGSQSSSPGNGEKSRVCDADAVAAARRTQPTPSPPSPAWKRALLIALLAMLFWLAFHLRPGARPPTKVIYASRYSKEFKYRPAASPVITEQLKDGRVRMRGALPT